MDPRGTWKPDYSRRWEMNWPELSCLSHHCCFCWAHTGSWVASFLGSGSLCHQSPHWKLSPAGRGQLSAIPTLFCPAGWMFGVPELHAGTYWSGVGSDTLLPRPAGPGELHTGRSDWLCRIYRGCSQDIGHEAWAPHGAVHLTESLLPAAACRFLNLFSLGESDLWVRHLSS